MELHEEIGAVRRETELDAAREDVWTLVSEPEGLATWLADEVDLDAVEPGARGTVTEHGEERHVTIEEVEPGRRVALSWCTPGGEPSLVELTLDDVEAEGDEGERRTRMVVVEIPLVTLRVVSAPAISAGGAAPGPQMALAHA
ncbi:SRPBCC domain-containing protein [Conexibacter woesei]|uniref:SRPBCC domain-containing protein n=1 Tax=Conexibacter woesei TaxID=191495 RepID=UPI0003FAD29C|nr:SRPBCC domain-containing protein [Conexibacter woesei]